MPDDDLPLDGLDRLAPSVDTEAGQALFDRRRRRHARRRTAARAGIAVVAVGIVGGLLVLRPSDDDRSTTSDDPAAAAEPRTVTTSEDGIELAITVADSVPVGTRLPVDVKVTNTTDHEIWWQSGGCAIPATVSLAWAPVDPSASEPPPTPPTWTPPEETLTHALGETGDLTWAPPYQTEAMTGWREISCTDDLRYDAIAPGASLDQAGSIEVRTPPGPLPGDGEAAVVVRFQAYLANPGLNNARQAEVVGQAFVRLIDAATRADADAAVAAFEGDPRLDEFVQDTSHLTNAVPGTEQSYSVSLTWWRDQWELWVKPTFSEQDRRDLRMRYDPTSSAITDVRTVQHQKAPDDEPGTTPTGIDAPDQIL